MLTLGRTSRRRATPASGNRKARRRRRAGRRVRVFSIKKPCSINRSGHCCFPGKLVNPPPSRPCPGSQRKFSPSLSTARLPQSENCGGAGHRCAAPGRRSLRCPLRLELIYSACKRSVVRQGCAAIGSSRQVSTTCWPWPKYRRAALVATRLDCRRGAGCHKASPTACPADVQSRSSSLIDVFDRVRSSTRLMITAQ